MSNKTQYVRDKIFREILEGKYKPGSKLPSEMEMAELTGTSRITTRRAFAELEKNGIIERVHGRGTFVSVSIAGNSGGGDYVALLTTLNDPFALEFVVHLERELAKQNMLLVLKITDEKPEKERAAAIELVAGGVRNLIIWPSGGVMSHDIFLRLRVLGANIIFFDRIIPGECADYIGLNHKETVVSLLKDAFARGFNEFIFVNYKGLYADSNKMRQEAFEEYCETNQYAYKIVLVDYFSALDSQLKAEMKKSSCDMKNPAYICVNDTVAMAVKDLSGSQSAVYGIDGFPAAVEKGIVTVAQPLSRMAAKAISLLQKQREQGAEWKAGKFFIKGKIIGGIK